MLATGISGLARPSAICNGSWLDESKAYSIITQEVYDHQFANGGIPAHEGLPHDQFSGFDGYAQPFNHQQPPFPGPPTPPNQHPVPAAARVLGQPQPGLSAASSADILPPLTKQELEDQAQSRRQGSNSDEDELTPAQSRRKAQNRAAYVPHAPIATLLS